MAPCTVSVLNMLSSCFWCWGNATLSRFRLVCDRSNSTIAQMKHMEVN